VIQRLTRPAYCLTMLLRWPIRITIQRMPIVTFPVGATTRFMESLARSMSIESDCKVGKERFQVHVRALQRRAEPAEWGIDLAQEKDLVGWVALEVQQREEGQQVLRVVEVEGDGGEMDATTSGS